jgi:TPR repeat protein
LLKESCTTRANFLRLHFDLLILAGCVDIGQNSCADSAQRREYRKPQHRGILTGRQVKPKTTIWPQGRISMQKLRLKPMTECRTLSTHSVIDSESPWRVKQRGWNWSYSYKSSVSEWRSLQARANNGDREAEWEIADRYTDGCKDKRGRIIVRRSAVKAAKWFRRAAEHGSGPAQNNLGILLGNGNGV